MQQLLCSEFTCCLRVARPNFLEAASNVDFSVGFQNFSCSHPFLPLGLAFLLPLFSPGLSSFPWLYSPVSSQILFTLWNHFRILRGFMLLRHHLPHWMPILRLGAAPGCALRGTRAVSCTETHRGNVLPGIGR